MNRSWLVMGAACCIVTNAEEYAPRTDFGARLEPRAVLMHGAGQSTDAFAAYNRIMPEDRRPGVYMHYIGLKGLSPSWADDLKATLRGYPGFVLPQIGLSMTGGASAHYEHEVAAGEHDKSIEALIAGLRRLATPVYLRIGYEFNGVEWNGYAPAPFTSAFIRIAGKLRASGLEVATVWNAAAGGSRNHLDYYPGDEYVDWFGINPFAAGDFSFAPVRSFVGLARERRKPVMIGETTPHRVGAQGGEESWRAWFVPFFDFMRNTPEIKQFGYINWDWSHWSRLLGENWDDWGDARLDSDSAAFVRERYIAALNHPVVMHAASESAFRRMLGYDDAAAPPAVEAVTPVSAPGGISVSWAPVEDQSGLARYYIYRNDTLVDMTVDTSLLDRKAELGSAAYQVAAMDRAGNLALRSEPALIEVNELDRIENGAFEADLSGWRAERFAAQAEFEAGVDGAQPIAGAASARVRVTRSTGTNWHVQLRQMLDLVKNRTYTVRFKARASEPVTVPFWIQQTVAPNAIHLNRSILIGTLATDFEYTFRSGSNEGPVAATFVVGNAAGVTVWFDDVAVIESR